MDSSMFHKARRFVYRNARPLDLARWRFHFEAGSPEDVLTYLSAYQNDDGGFGHALEPDFWNPGSTPIATWMATQRLREIGFDNKDHPIVRGILRYLDSGKDFVDGQWLNSVPANNNYPHAVWWACENEAGLPHDNPSVSLAGFALRFADESSPLHQKAGQTAALAVERFLAAPTDEMHTLRCFLDLLCWCEGQTGFDCFDLDRFRGRLYEAIGGIVCRDPSKWFTEYVCKPSVFFESGHKVFSILDRSLLEEEARMLAEQQLEDGSFPVTWQWWTDYREYEISANWWRSALIVDNLCFLRSMAQ